MCQLFLILWIKASPSACDWCLCTKQAQGLITARCRTTWSIDCQSLGALVALSKKLGRFWESQEACRGWRGRQRWGSWRCLLWGKGIPHTHMRGDRPEIKVQSQKSNQQSFSNVTIPPIIKVFHLSLILQTSETDLPATGKPLRAFSFGRRGKSCKSLSPKMPGQGRRSKAVRDLLHSLSRPDLDRYMCKCVQNYTDSTIRRFLCALHMLFSERGHMPPPRRLPPCSGETLIWKWGILRPTHNNTPW